jgi:ribosomal protein S18 acetylase RimI-like enzyme
MEFTGAGKPWWEAKMTEPPTSQEITLRQFQYPADYSKVIELWKNAGPGIHIRRSDEGDEIAKKIQRDPDLFLIAELQGEIIGSVLGGFDGRRGMVYHLAVDAKHRKNGLGEALMNELEKRMVQKGCLRTYLLVTRDNLEAIRFYEARGWETMDLFIYAKDLA